ncbi:hypothetical protein [Actinomadura sp. WMMA1423]|uniref:LppU/SCO3897 family protein n=1 Tax=Actinomadura sp. WMMA1423 TaxID=2591108 RepID=UPI0011479970|nr:hypothetical protein [Actinomadura sp. WMMA1423]
MANHTTPYPSPGQPYQYPPPAPPRARRGRAAKRIAGLVLLLAVVGAVVLVRVAAGKSAPETAQAGDCVARDGDGVKVVKCTDSTAAFKVVGKVEDKTRVQFSLGSETICRPFEGATSAFWKGEVGGEGYVLCLGRLTRP